jgi:hypothetical protein
MKKRYKDDNQSFADKVGRTTNRLCSADYPSFSASFLARLLETRRWSDPEIRNFACSKLW